MVSVIAVVVVMVKNSFLVVLGEALRGAVAGAGVDFWTTVLTGIGFADAGTPGAATTGGALGAAGTLMATGVAIATGSRMTTAAIAGPSTAAGTAAALAAWASIAAVTVSAIAGFDGLTLAGLAATLAAATFGFDFFSSSVITNQLQL